MPEDVSKRKKQKKKKKKKEKEVFRRGSHRITSPDQHATRADTDERNTSSHHAACAGRFWRWDMRERRPKKMIARSFDTEIRRISDIGMVLVPPVGKMYLRRIAGQGRDRVSLPRPLPLG